MIAVIITDMAAVTTVNGKTKLKKKMKKLFKIAATAAVAFVGITIADRKLGWGLAEWIEKKYDKGIDKISRNRNSEAVGETEITAEQ